MRNRTKRLIFFHLIMIIFLLVVSVYFHFEVKNYNKDIFSSYINNINFEKCEYKFFRVHENNNYEVRYFELDFYKNLGNLKCINSITNIEFDNKVIYVAKSTQLNFIFMLSFFGLFFLGKYRFNLLYLLFILKLILDFYSSGLSDFGYPYFISLLILFYTYEK